MKRFVRPGAFLLLAALLFCLSGCYSGNIDQYFSLPMASEEYRQLQSLIDEELASGSEYAAPIHGSYRQSVQLSDVDGDGADDQWGMGNGVFQPDGLFTRAQLAQTLWRMGGSLTARGCSFPDVDPSAWYYDAVMWAVKNGVTVGITPTVFAPLEACNRAQMVEFLWNAAGKPAATIKAVPFTDVPDAAWYEDALLWAYEAGIVAGTTSTTFSPAKECTRAEMVCFLVRLLSDGATDNMPFVDVPASAWYYNEVQWAWANGLTVGTSATTFSPDKVCNRAEAVEFLYNAFAE